MMTQTRRQRIKKAFEGVERKPLAAKLGVKRHYVDAVAVGLKIVSHKRAREFEELTEGQVPASVLRPDIWPSPKECKKRRGVEKH